MYLTLFLILFVFNNLSADEIADTIPDINVPPSLECPTESLVYSTGPFDCTAAFIMPFPIITDSCASYELFFDIYSEVKIPTQDFGGYNLDTVSVRSGSPGDYVSGVSTKTVFIRYFATTSGDTTSIDCPIIIYDGINPVAVCDNDLHISIGGAGYERIYAEDVDEGSHDNCTDVRLEIRRENGEWGEYIDFDCEDVGTYVTIELRVWDDANGNEIWGDWYGNSNPPIPDDLNDNTNVCWIEVFVENVSPVCIAPPDTLINCNNPIFSSIDWNDSNQLNEIFGTATAGENCNATTEQISINININDCGWGTVTRVFYAIDEWGETSTNPCNQFITISEMHDYEIKFPKDAVLQCGEINPDTLVYNVLGCDLFTVNVTNEQYAIFGYGLCSKILRTYKLINWCEWDGESDPINISRNEDCDGDDGDEDIWIIVRTADNGGNLSYTTFLDRDNEETNFNPYIGHNRCGTGQGAALNGHWSNSNNNPELTSIGFWQYAQVIDILDDEEPTVEVADYDVFCTQGGGCTALVDITFTVTENCYLDMMDWDTWIDLDADGEVDSTAILIEDEAAATPTSRTFNISGTYPIGTHSFVLSISDYCNNIVPFDIPFEIIDCGIPNPVCIDGMDATLIPQPDGCCGKSIWAADFIENIDADCSGALTYSIHRSADVDSGAEIPHQEQIGLALDCNDNPIVPLYIYVWDSANNPYAVQPDGSLGGANYAYCETYVALDWMTIDCESFDINRIGGTVQTEESEGIEGGELTLSGSGMQNMLTGNDGYYEFSETGDGLGADYSITPYLNVQAPGSISSYDLILITKHILGIQLLDSPYKIIAADVNNSGTVSSMDLMVLRGLILGTYDEFPNNTFWRFVDASYVFPDPTNPWLETFPEVKNIITVIYNELDHNFIGAAIGDVNNSAIPNFVATADDRNREDLFTLTTENIKVKAGLDYKIDFTAADLAKIEGYQFTLLFDKAVLNFESIEYGIAGAENFGLNYISEGIITTSWDKYSGIFEEGSTSNKVLFSLHFNANAGGVLSDLLSLSSRITKAEAYDNDGVLDVAIDFVSADISKIDFEVYQNIPNPFKGETKIGFNLPEDAAVDIVIQDITGKTLKLIKENGVRGYNGVTFDANTLGVAGVFYYTVSTAEYVGTKRMIIVK